MTAPDADPIKIAAEIEHHLDEALAHLIFADTLREALPGRPEHTLWRELNAYRRDVHAAVIRA